MGVASTPEHIIRDKRLSVGAKATWAALSSYANGFYGHKHVWPSQETLADDLCVTARCIRNWIGELEAAELLHVIRQNTRGGRESNVYALHFPQEECQQEAQRNSGSSGIPMGLASPEEAQRKPAGSPEEARRNAGSSKVLEGSEGLEGSKTSSAPVKPTQEAFALQQDEPKATPKWAKASQVAALWNELMPLQVSCKPDKINSGVLAAAFDSHGLDGLRDLFVWAQSDDWMCGRKGKPSMAQAWLSKGGLATAQQKRTNGSTTSKAQEAEDYYKRGTNA